MPPRSTCHRLTAALILGIAVLASSGCQIGQLVGGMMASDKLNGSTDVDAQYTDLANHTFAVIVSADRLIQSDSPSFVPTLTLNITRKLEENAGASARVTGQGVLAYQASNPGWVLKTPEEIGKELGVERVVYIEINEYRLNEPGNRHLWDGAVSGNVQVFETDTDFAEIAVFEMTVEAVFPDQQGFGPSQVPQNTIELELQRRFVNLSSELFYDYTRPNRRKY